MINAVIIEDEQGARRSLQAILKEYFPDVQVVGVGKNVAEGVKVLKDNQPDLVFLDIRLPDGDGFEILNNFEKPGFDVIFTTAYGDYREKAFDYFTLQYLLKPIDIDKLEKALEYFRTRRSKPVDALQTRLLEQVLKSSSDLLVLPQNNGYVLEKIEDVVRCEASGNYTEIHLANQKKYLSSRTMKFYDEMLADHGFFRIHKSHLVNVKYVREIRHEGSLRLADGSNVPVSQRSKTLLMKFLAKRTSGLS